ncbi:MAG: DUF1285 domain-containing protein [Oleiphilaceae bacterium]|nr:DUF1285 domain-containing protein [Oleiphilaceae bacterium]
MSDENKHPPVEDLARRFDQVLDQDTALKAPPVEQWDPPHRGDLDMRISRDGQWHYQGKPLTRQSLVRLFASIVRLEPNGDYVLVTPAEKFRIQVEDVPFVAHSLEVTGQGDDQVLWLTTSTDDRLALGPEHALVLEQGPDSQEPAPYVWVRRNLQARIERSTWYHLINLAEEREHQGETHLGVLSQGQFFSLGCL